MNILVSSETNRFKTEKNNYSMLSEIFKSPVPKSPIVIDFTPINKSNASSQATQEGFTIDTSLREVNLISSEIIDDIKAPIDNQNLNETLFRIETEFEPCLDFDFNIINDTISSSIQSTPFELQSFFNDTDFISSINFNFDTNLEDFLNQDSNVQQSAFEFENCLPLFSDMPVCEN